MREELSTAQHNEFSTTKRALHMAFHVIMWVEAGNTLDEALGLFGSSKTEVIKALPEYNRLAGKQVVFEDLTE